MEGSLEFAQTLRVRVQRAERKTYEASKGSHRLTLVALGDAPEDVGFTFWEARTRGWSPILAGRVDADTDLAVTFCAQEYETNGLSLLAAFLDDTAELPVSRGEPTPTYPLGLAEPAAPLNN